MLSCDHAGRELPARYESLGLSEGLLRTCPDVYDHGAAEIFVALRARLDCLGVDNRLCRLLIDVNRYRDQASLIPTHCGEREIPGNRGLDATERIEGCGYSVAINSPFTLWRDVLRVPPGTDEGRFNAAAVVLETNDRFCGRAGITEVLEGAIREVVAEHSERWHGSL